MNQLSPPVLVADIGGTNTRVGLADGAQLRPQSVQRFRNDGHASLTAVLRTYLDAARPGTLSGACLAVAGPVQSGAARMTNLDWQIDLATLRAASGVARVALLNDLQAQGHALDHLAPAGLRNLIPARPKENTAREGAPTRLVIGVGTGFNAAAVHATAAGPMVTASECGHATLPVRDMEELALTLWLERQLGFIAVEDVLSGRGLERVDAYVADRDVGKRGPKGATRGAAEIMAAMDAREDRALAAGALFVRLLGRVAGDLALTHLPFGGIYLAGGVARAFGPHFGQFSLSQAFTDKGRFAGFMAQFPLVLIEDDYAALTGCAAYLAATAPGKA